MTSRPGPTAHLIGEDLESYRRTVQFTSHHPIPPPPIFNFRVDVPVPVPVLFSTYANEILAFTLVDVLRGTASRLRWQKNSFGWWKERYSSAIFLRDCRQSINGLHYYYIGRYRNRGMIRFNHLS